MQRYLIFWPIMLRPHIVNKWPVSRQYLAVQFESILSLRAHAAKYVPENSKFIVKEHRRSVPSWVPFSINISLFSAKFGQFSINKFLAGMDLEDRMIWKVLDAFKVVWRRIFDYLCWLLCDWSACVSMQSSGKNGGVHIGDLLQITVISSWRNEDYCKRVNASADTIAS
jgi:hypothetical protein